ncbi:hypothetical protein [Priestia endophytica]|nr:hypothetical protein [Priestia endophytica]
MSRSQLQALFQLKSVRNANRVLFPSGCHLLCGSGSQTEDARKQEEN